jgi:hypothetical protein
VRALGQQRRVAAAPPSHPAGGTIEGGGTWGEGRPDVSLQQFEGKRGYQTPSVSGFAGMAGETPSSPVSVPDKRSAPVAQGVAAVERSEAEARSPAPQPRGQDPCAGSATKTPDGSKPEATDPGRDRRDREAARSTHGADLGRPSRRRRRQRAH